MTIHPDEHASPSVKQSDYRPPKRWHSPVWDDRAEWDDRSEQQLDNAHCICGRPTDFCVHHPCAWRIAHEAGLACKHCGGAL